MCAFLLAKTSKSPSKVIKPNISCFVLCILILKLDFFSIDHRPTMQPKRPLPDLCLISVFKMLTPNDQLQVAKMSHRCARLVRAANRIAKSMTFAKKTTLNDDSFIKNINKFSIYSMPVMELAQKFTEPFPAYPLTLVNKKWNSFHLDENQFIDKKTVTQIGYIFSSVTDLKFENFDNAACNSLISILKYTEFAKQLTSLNVFCFGANLTDLTTQNLLIDIINKTLPSLKFLACEFENNKSLPNLTILTQLKAVALNVHGSLSGSLFFQSLEYFAGKNETLEVYLTDHTTCVQHLSSLVQKKIVYFVYTHINALCENVALFCQQFSSLTSLSIGAIEVHKFDTLITSLSTLTQLVHLAIELNLIHIKSDQIGQSSQKIPTTKLTSVRALDLCLYIKSHSIMQFWHQTLNLEISLPHLQAIHLKNFYCGNCDVNLRKYHSGDYSKCTTPNTLSVLECFCESFPLIHNGIDFTKILIFHEKPFFTLEQMMFVKRQLLS